MTEELESKVSDAAIKMADDYLDISAEADKIILTAPAPTESQSTPKAPQLASGTIKIAGCISSIDKWGRLHVLTPKARWNRDTLNTSIILESLNKKLKVGSSPVKWNGFVAKTTPKTAFIVAGKSVDAKAAAGIPLELSISYSEFSFPDKVGWSFTLISARSISI